MGIVELDPIVRIKLIIFVASYLALMFIFRYIMRNYLQVEKKGRVFRKYVNTRHKKIDQLLTGIIIILMIGVYFYETRIADGMNWFFTTGGVLLVLIIVTEIVRAYMEWKYSENPKEYLLTLSELLFSVVILVSAYLVNLFSLFR